MFKFFPFEKRVNKIFIMADLGLTNGGSLGRALELIEVASELGVDCVKFQMIDSDELLGDKTFEYTYPTILHGDRTENMYEMFLGLEFSDYEWREIKNKCDELGVGLIITCHVESAVQRINSLDLPVNKICTWSLNHYRMIERLAGNGKPLIIDTGTIDLNELNDLKNFYNLHGGGEVIVLFDFHTENLSDINFQSIKQLLSAGYRVGYTPQGRSDWFDYMAIGLGITILEKRLTLSRTKPSNGHWKSLEPSEFSDWMKKVNECAIAYGENTFSGTESDIQGSLKWYKSAWLVKDVKKGELISEDAFIYKRPGIGVSSKEMRNYIGQEFRRDFSEGEMFLL